MAFIIRPVLCGLLCLPALAGCKPDLSGTYSEIAEDGSLYALRLRDSEGHLTGRLEHLRRMAGGQLSLDAGTLNGAEDAGNLAGTLRPNETLDEVMAVSGHGDADEVVLSGVARNGWLRLDLHWVSEADLQRQVDALRR